MKQVKQIFLPFVGLLIVLGLLGFLVWTVQGLFSYLLSIPKEIAAPLITGAATVIVATATVMIGRHFERKKELDALYRDKKTEIYDEFLQKFFQMFFDRGEKSAQVEVDLVPFLQDFTRKLVLWSGPEVIAAFVTWKDHLAKGEPDAQSIFLTEAFLVAIRNDLRHSSRGLQKGFFARLFLRSGGLFMSMAARNPNVTLKELAAVEQLLSQLPDAPTSPNVDSQM